MNRIFPILSFIFSLLLGYGSELSPYYVKLFAGEKLKTIGLLRQYQEPCLDDSKGDAACLVQYRIPHDLFAGKLDYKAVGLGILIRPITVSCQESPNLIMETGNPSETGRVMSDFNKYQIFQLNPLKCNGDILVKNWAPKGSGRYGYANGVAVIGDLTWVELTKNLSQFFQGELSEVFSLAFLIFFIAVSSIKKLTQYETSGTFMDGYATCWLGFNFMVSGLFFDKFIPMEIGFSGVSRVVSFFGACLAWGPLLNYWHGLEKLKWGSHKITSLLLRSPAKYQDIKLFYLVIIFILFLPGYYHTYRVILIGAGVLGLITSICFKDLLIGFFSISIISDVLKISMVPYLPASRLFINFSGCILVASLFQQLRVLQYRARLEGGLDIAKQVAHDIRSPLAVLNNVLQNAGALSDETKSQIAHAVQRIRDTANGLLNGAERSELQLYLKSGYNRAEILDEPKTVEPLLRILSLIVSEKRVEIQDRRPIIMLADNLESQPLFVLIQRNRFFGIISNLLNNALEALGEEGHIEVSVRVELMKIQIIILDNGSGMTPDVLSKLGEKGFSYGKKGSESGSGLGVYGARETLETWGGSLNFESQAGKWTRAIITLNQSSPPMWFADLIEISPSGTVIVVDDDPGVYSAWKARFSKFVDLKVVGFQTAEAVTKWYRENFDQVKDPLYLCDQMFSGSKELGLEIIDKLGVRRQSILVTSRWEDIDLQMTCEKRGVRMLPKVMIGTVKIRS